MSGSSCSRSGSATVARGGSGGVGCCSGGPSRRRPGVRLGILRRPDEPWPANWQVHHYACWRELDNLDTRWTTIGGGPSYEVAIERIRTYSDLVWWSAHFGRKGFLDDTDWSVVMNEAHGEVFERDWAAHPRRFRPTRGFYATDPPKDS